MSYDVLVVSAHLDAAEVQMGGTLVNLVHEGMRVLLYAEAFKSHSPLLVASSTVFLPGLHA